MLCDTGQHQLDMCRQHHNQFGKILALRVEHVLCTLGVIFFTSQSVRPENLDMPEPARDCAVFLEIIMFVREHQQEDDVGNYLSR